MDQRLPLTQRNKTHNPDSIRTRKQSRRRPTSFCCKCLWKSCSLRFSLFKSTQSFGFFFQPDSKPSPPIRISGLTCFYTLLPFNCFLLAGTNLPGWRQIKKKKGRRIDDDSAAASSSRSQSQQMPSCFLTNCSRTALSAPFSE